MMYDQGSPFDARRRALLNLSDQSAPAPSAPSKAPETIGGVLGSVIGGIGGAFAAGPAGIGPGIAIGSSLGGGAGKLIEGNPSGTSDIGSGVGKYASFSDYLKKQQELGL